MKIPHFMSPPYEGPAMIPNHVDGSSFVHARKILSCDMQILIW